MTVGFLEVTRQTLLRQLRSKVYWFLLIMSLVFAAAFFFGPPDANDVRGDELFGIVTYMSCFTVVIPFVVLYLAVYAISGDIDDRTSVYLFTRPLSRSSLMLGKWLAVVALGMIFGFVAITSLYLVIAHSGREWRDGVTPTPLSYVVMLLSATLASVGYASVGCFFGALFRRPMIISLAFVGIQEFVSRLPAEAGIHSMTVADPVRRFMDARLDVSSRELHEILMGRIPGPNGDSDPALLGDPLPALAKLIVVSMVLALLIYGRREYDSRPRE